MVGLEIIVLIFAVNIFAFGYFAYYIALPLIKELAMWFEEEDERRKVSELLDSDLLSNR